MESGKPGHPVIAEDTGIGRLQVRIQAQGASFDVDEPVCAGGLASGPSPYDLLGASLGACTVMTIKLYAQRKSFQVTHVQVIVHHHRHPGSGRDVFQRSIFIGGVTDGEQMRQLLAVAERCPVSKTLVAGADITTTRNATPVLTARRRDDDEHLRAMEAACEDCGDR